MPTIPSNRPESQLDERNTADGFYFQAKEGDEITIRKRQPDGSVVVIIADGVDEGHRYQYWWPRMSPDKSTLLWYRSPADGDLNNYAEAELWMSDPDGGNRRLVIEAGEYGWTAQGVADWSPDGTELVMAATDDTGHWHIFITDHLGRNPKKVSRRNSLMADPSWSPDGTRITYAAYPVDYTGLPFNLFALEIHVMDRDGTNETRLTFDDYRDHDPYWSPDGAEIAFESQHDLLHCLLGSWAVRKVEVATGEVTDLVFDEHVNGVVTWSSDSEHLYFPRTRCAEYTEVMRVDRDGANLTPFLSLPEVAVLDGDLVD